MDPKAPGLWLLPTLGRVETGLRRFLEAAIATGVSTPGLILVDINEYQSNPAFDTLPLPEGWDIFVTQGVSVSDKLSEALATLVSPVTEWVGYLQNDLVPETSGWDVAMIRDLNGWNVVSTNDGNKAPKRLNGATVWSMDLVRAVGGLTVPGAVHFYLDDMWEAIGRFTGNWQVRMDIMVRHAHASVIPQAADEVTARANSSWDNDERAWSDWRVKGLPAAISRVKDLMRQKGVEVYRPNLSDISVMIATPCGSGQYERLFMGALINTLEELRNLGANAEFAEMPYCSDIALARAKLFGRFIRSSHTNLFFIDDDMGWRAQDVVRLLELRKDFAAVAGPRKVTPVEFAVNVSDDHGRPIPIQQDGATGCLLATGIGMAFSVLSRACVNRMVAAYRDLEFLAADGRTEYAVFNPLVVNKRYLSEDFAFCHRWRSVGGMIYVLPDVSLEHVGSQVWSGDWLSHLEAKMAAERRAA